MNDRCEFCGDRATVPDPWGGAPTCEGHRWTAAPPTRKVFRDWAPCSEGCLGWHVMNDNEIQACDAAGRFEYDDEAARHVEKSYAELLEVAQQAKYWLQAHKPGDGVTPQEILRSLVRAIENAQGETP